VAKASTTTAVATATPTILTPEELTKLLLDNGNLAQPTSDFRRMRLDNGKLVTLTANGEIEETFPPRYARGGKPEPALTVQIVQPPKYYMAHFLGAEVDDRGNPTRAFDPTRIGRPDLMKSFSRKWDNADDQQNDHNPANEVYDQVTGASGSRGQWKGDMKVRIAPEDGLFKGDEPVFTLSLSASSCLDFRGTSRNPMAGTVQEHNFLVQLAQFAAAHAAEEGGDAAAQSQAALNAQIALTLGGVVADVYLLTDRNEEKGISWTVISFKPVHVEFPDPTAALPATTETPEADDAVIDSDNLPF
jgi:hypothetical protein